MDTTTTTNDLSSRIAALHTAVRRLVQGESPNPPTRAELGMALELADLAAEMAQQEQEQGQEQIASECGRMQVLCYDLLSDMYSSVEEFEHKTYTKGKARAHDDEEDETPSVTSPVSSSSASSGRKSVRFSEDQDVPRKRQRSSGGVIELPVRVRDNDNGECSTNSSLLASANAEERAPRPVLRRQKGQRFDGCKCS